MQKKPTSAYVHIPFCTQICYYCDFSKVFIKNQPVDSYLEHLLEEFRSYDIQKLSTLYIGGGTPTALSAPQLEVLLDGLAKNLDLSVLEELTIEANPGDLNADKIAVLKQSPVNRVSLGVQTFDDKMLKKIGRSHLEKDIYENIDRLKLAGFDNISIDLIYALPGQTMDQVKENVAKAISLDIPHMSLYSLILENHTVFMNRMRRGKLPLPKEELEAEMFDYIIIDCPPLNAVADAIPVSSIVDGTLFVVSAMDTAKQEAKNALTMLQRNGANVLGCVLTKVDITSKSYYSYYGNYS